MRKFIFVTILSIFIAGNAKAEDELSIVRLRNGIEIKGDIIEEIPGKQVTIRTTDGDVFVYNMNEISALKTVDDIKAERLRKERKKERLSKLDYGNFKGYRGLINLSFGGDLVGPLGYMLDLSIVNGYNFGPYFYMGIGVGAKYNIDAIIGDEWINCPFCEDYFDWFDYAISKPAFTIPVFLYFQTAFVKNRRVSPYLSASVGYNIDPANHTFVSTSSHGICPPIELKSNLSGIYISPSIGVEIRIKRKQAVSIGFSMPVIVGMASDYPYKYFGLSGNLGFSF